MGALEASESLEEIVAKAAIAIMASPEMRSVPIYNREDALASVAYFVSDAIDQLGGGPVDRAVLSKITCQQYRSQFVTSDHLDRVCYARGSSGVQ